MFMRLVQLNVEIQMIYNFRETYNKDIIPRLQKMPGCRFVGLIESGSEESEFISLTLWDTQEQAESYEKGGVYKELLGKLKPFLRNTSEWKVQLSENLELEYKPVTEEPVIKKYSVKAQTDSSATGNIDSRLYVRIVSLSIQEGKEDEFRKIYTDEIIPALLSTKGCRYCSAILIWSCVLANRIGQNSHGTVLYCSKGTASTCYCSHQGTALPMEEGS